MGATFNKSDLRKIYQHLQRLLPPGSKPLTAEEVVGVGELLEKTRTLIVEAAGAIERGRLVFSWRVPRELALTGNAYAGSRGWKKHKDRKMLDAMVMELLPAFPKALLHGAHRQRWVRATRFSTQLVDECALDLIGAKLALDSLKRANIIHDDNAKFVHREPRQMKAKRGETHLLVEVYEIANEQVTAPEPACAPVEQVQRKLGAFTKAIIGETP